MRTFPYPLALVSLLASCASAPQAQPEAASTQVMPDEPSAADAVRIAELARQAAPLVDAFTNSEAVLTRDARRVIFVSNRDGLPQIYLEKHAGPAQSSQPN